MPTPGENIRAKGLPVTVSDGSVRQKAGMELSVSPMQTWFLRRSKLAMMSGRPSIVEARHTMLTV